MKKTLIIPIILLLFAACSKSPDTPPISIDPPTHGGSRIFICNEGNFMYGNASLSVYDPASGVADNQVFYNVNNFPLGDVCQSMRVIDRRGFLVVNNSGKVVVFDVDSYKYIATIKGLTSPRYIELIDDNRIYISDLYSQAISIVNPSTYEVTGYIQVGASTEQMVRHGDYVYVCSWSFNNKIYKIDTRTDKVVGSLTVTKQPNSMVLDRDGKIWVLSDGGYVGSPYVPEIASLTVIDAGTFSVEKQMDFANIELSPSELAINGSGDTIYYISGGWGSNGPTNGIHRMSIEDRELPTVPFIAENGALFYALGIDPVTSEIYVSDAIDYVQRGTVIRFDATGTEKSRFKVDIIPGAFCFYTAK